MSGGNLLIPREFLALLFLLIAAQYFGLVKKTVSRRNRLIYSWLVLVMAFAFVRFQPIDVTQNLVRISQFIVALAMLRIYVDAGRQRLLDDLHALVTPMAYQAIVTVLLALAVPGFFTFVEFDSQRFHTFLGVFNYADTYYASTFVRPIGFFWEPGILQIYLNMLLFTLFVRRAPLRKIALVMVAVLATQSTTGIAVASAVACYFAGVPLFSRGRTFRKIIILTAALASGPILFSYATDNLEAKLSGNAAASSVARLYDLQSGYLVIREHPLLGIGFNTGVYIDLSARLNPDTSGLAMANQENGRLSTNGLLNVLYSVGIPLGLVYVASFMLQSLVPHRLAFGGLLLLGLTTEPLSMTPFFAMFAFSGLTLSKRRPGNKNETGVPPGHAYHFSKPQY